METVCRLEPQTGRVNPKFGPEDRDGVCSRLDAREKEESYMGRWIRGPGTGDPRDSWKEKREA